jgi:transposase
LIGSNVFKGMIREISVDFDEVLLLPPAIEDWVGPDHIARFVREFVSQVDLAALGFEVHDKETGRPGYSCALLLRAWLYGFLTRQRSTRKLERACKNDMGAIWLTGNEQPDHSTLWNFFRDNKKRFQKIFKQSALIACRRGFVDMNFLAMDGTKVRACANNSDAVDKKDLEGALEALDQEIEHYTQSVLEAGDQSCDKLPQELADTASLRKAISEDLAVLEDMGVSRASTVDPESRTMKTAEGNKFSYNAQAAVDSSSGIVVGCDVAQDANDSSQLNAMLDQVEETLQVRPDLTAVDSGYFSAAEITRAHEQGRELYISMRGRAPKEEQPLHAWHFRMDAERNLLTCPIGGELTFRGRSVTHGGDDIVDRYRCVDHALCPFAQICSSDTRGRTVEVGDGREHVLRQWQKQKEDPDARVKHNRRGSTVEPRFGHLKRNLAFRQLEHRGLTNAKAIWSLQMCCTNLGLMANRLGYQL